MVTTIFKVMLFFPQARKVKPPQIVLCFNVSYNLPISETCFEKKMPETTWSDDVHLRCQQKKVGPKSRTTLQDFQHGLPVRFLLQKKDQ